KPAGSPTVGVGGAVAESRGGAHARGRRPVPQIPSSAAEVPIPAGYARGNRNWATARRIMRIAHVVAAAAPSAGPGQVFLGRARARLASEARLGGGSLTGTGAAASTGRPFIGVLGGLRPAGSPHELARVDLMGSRWPGRVALRFPRRQNTHC